MWQTPYRIGIEQKFALIEQTLWEIVSIEITLPCIKTQKKTHIQLLCNYPSSITISVQLSIYKYDVLINKLSCQKVN
jgi:hypothetical protein